MFYDLINNYLYNIKIIFLLFNILLFILSYIIKKENKLNNKIFNDNNIPR